jgi:hypothetical protein
VSPPELRLLEDGPDDRETALVDLLDRVLDTGLVVRGEAVVTLAGVELLFVGLNLVLCSPDARLPTQGTPS